MEKSPQTNIDNATSSLHKIKGQGKKTSHSDFNKQVLLIFILIIVSSTILLQAGSFKNVEASASVFIEKKAHDQINQKLDSMDLNPAQRKELFTKEKGKLSYKLDQEISIEAKKRTDVFRTQEGTPYLYGYDTLFFMRMAKNILQHGHQGDELKKGKPYLSYNAAPIGRIAPSTLYPNIIVGFHKIFTLFTIQSLEQTAYFLPVLLGVGSVLLLFFIGKSLFSLWMGFYSALIFSIHPLFITWNHAGFADTNAVNLFLSLIIVYSFVKLLHSDKKFFWGSATGIFIIIFYHTWTGAFYILFVLSALFAARLIFNHHKNIKLMVVIAIITIALFSLGLFIYGDLLQARLFMDNTSIHSHISELQPLTFQELIIGAGGILGLIISMLALVNLIYHTLTKKDSWRRSMLLIWFILPFIAGIFSRRFLFYSSPSLALILGYSWNKSRVKLIRLMKKSNLKVRHWTIITALFILLVPLLFLNSIGYLQQVTPPINDASVSAMEYIKQTTDSNAIIATWWDYGYQYQYFAERGTLVDPGYTKQSRVESLANIFLTTNETYARNMLQTLYCGVDLQEERNTPSETPPCTNPPQGLVAATEQMTKLVNSIQKISDFKKPIRMSSIKRCNQHGNEVKCGDYVVKAGEARKNNMLLNSFYDYRGNKTIVKDQNNESDVSFVLFAIEERLYYYTISSAYADCMFARFIARDSFDYFTLLHSTEFPEQVVIYEMKWNTSS